MFCAPIYRFFRFFFTPVPSFRQLMAYSASTTVTTTLPVAAFPKRFRTCNGFFIRPAPWIIIKITLCSAIHNPDPICRMIHF